MKKLLLFWCLIGMAGSLVAQDEKERFTERTRVIMQALMNEDYDVITDFYEPIFAIHNTSESLRQNMSQQQLGKLLRTGEPVMEQTSSNVIFRIPLFFENGKKSLTLNYAPNRCLTGLFIMPPTGIYEMPEYVVSLSFREETISFGTEGWKLPGVLTYPNDGKPHPVVMIVHDTGPLDRDGLKGSNRIYRDLAWGLASKGYCVFRYDKRSSAHGPKLFMHNYQGAPYTCKEEIVDDARAAIEAIKHNSRVDTSRIFVLGHGQGGMLMPMIVDSTTGVKGVVLFAANARSLQDVMIGQMEYLYPDGSGMTLNQYNEKKRVQAQAKYAKRKNIPMTAPRDSLPFGMRADYWNFMNAYQPVTAFEQMPYPALVLFAERDFQTTKADDVLWRQAATKRKNTTQFKSYPTLNHLFITGSGPSKPAEYQTQGHVDERVILDLIQWLNELP